MTKQTEMINKRTVIDQALCNHVKLLLAGGARVNEAAEITKVGHATISRIKAAGFDAEVYRANMEAARAKEKKEQEEQLKGQMEMELTTAEEPKAEPADMTKVMRFQAAMVDRLVMELDKMNDTLNMFIRVMRHE